jgi:hypothetical protein
MNVKHINYVRSFVDENYRKKINGLNAWFSEVHLFTISKLIYTSILDHIDYNKQKDKFKKLFSNKMIFNI